MMPKEYYWLNFSDDELYKVWHQKIKRHYEQEKKEETVLAFSEELFALFQELLSRTNKEE